MIIFEMVFCVVLGSLFHFTYDWSRKNPLVGWLTAVNESTWEHMKLAILPMILTIPIDRAFYDGNSNYWLAKFLMIFVAMILIPALFYLEKILLKKNKLAIDISIFCFGGYLWRGGFWADFKFGATKY